MRCNAAGRSDDDPAAHVRLSPFRNPLAGLVPARRRASGRSGSSFDWPADIEIFAVRHGKPVGFQSFPDTTLVVIDGRQVAVGGLLVDEQCERLAPALDATVELGIGLRKHAGVQIGATEIEVADPGVAEDRSPQSGL